MIASTAYLDLFLHSITETSLLKTFLRFILLHRHDNDTILDTLLTRISSNSRVSLAYATARVQISIEKTLFCQCCRLSIEEAVYSWEWGVTNVALFFLSLVEALHGLFESVQDIAQSQL